MSVLQSVLYGSSSKRGYQSKAYPQWLSFLGTGTSSKENVTPDRALTLSAYFAGVRVISEDVGKLPCILYKADDKGDKFRYRESKLWNMITRRPNPFMSSQQFRELLTQWALGWGGGVAEIQQDMSGNPIGLWPIHPSRVAITREAVDNVIYRWYWIHNDDGSKVRIEDSKIIHVRGFGDIDNGYSVAGYMAETIGHGLAAKRFGSAFLGNAARPGGYFTTTAPMKPEVETNFREQWASWYSGAGNSGKTPILGGGLEFKPITVNPDEAQYIETCKFSVTEIARALRVNPNKIQDWERATFNNMEQANTDHVVDTLLPWLTRIEHELTYKLFGGDPYVFVEHLVDGMLRGDMASRGEYIQKQIRNGILTVNEARRMDNRNGVEGGDKHYITRDLIPVELIGVLPNPTAPAPQPNNTREVEEPEEDEEETPDARAVFHPILKSAVLYEMNKEKKAVERMQKKHGLKTQDFAAAVQAFFSEQESHYNARLSASLAGYHAISGKDMADGTITERIAQYCTESIRQITQCETVAQLSKVLDPEAWADGFIDDLLFEGEANA